MGFTRVSQLGFVLKIKRIKNILAIMQELVVPKGLRTPELPLFKSFQRNIFNIRSKRIRHSSQALKRYSRKNYCTTGKFLLFNF